MEIYMKEKILIIALGLIILLAGCTSDKPAPDSSNATPSPAVTAEVKPTEAPKSTPTPTPSPKPTATPVPTATPTPTPIPSIYDRLTETDDLKVYKYDLNERHCDTLTGQYVCSKLILNYGNNDTGKQTLETYDLVTGESNIIDADISVYYSNLQILNNGTIIVSDTSEDKISMYTLDGDLITSFSYPFVFYNDSYMFSNSCDYLYYFSDGDLMLYRYEISTGEITPMMETKAKASGYISGISDDDRILSMTFYPDYGNIYFKEIDTETFEMTDVEDSGSFSYDVYAPDNSESVRPDKEITALHHFIGDTPSNDIEIASSSEQYSYDVDWERRLVITANYIYSNTNYIEFTCYNLDTGKPLSNWLLYDTGYYSCDCYDFDFEKGLMYLTRLEDSIPQLYVWEYGKDDITSYKYLRMNYLPASLDAHRKELEEKYNIFIYLGSEISATDSEYLIKTCSDFQRMDETLNTLDEVLSKYPEGFFEQIKTGTIKSLGIYLCNGFTKQYNYQIDTAVALAGVDDYERYLFLDVSYWGSMEQNIYHEISHWIDHQINDQVIYGKNDDFEENWLKLNPEKVHYEMDYNSTSPFSKYTFDSAKDKDNIYFTDTYALTYPTEDRARLFEYLMVYNGTEYMESPHLRAKLHYFFDYIRKAFDTTGWPEETAWEEKLRMLDEYYSGSGKVSLEDIYPEYFENLAKLEEQYSYMDPYAVG